jgi:hypothetical protein
MVLEHKYLLANLFGLLPLSVALLLARRLRSTAILCGAILCLYSPPVAWLYERVYWTPGHIFGGGWGVEDVMFCFHAGVMSWLCALGPWGNKVQIYPVATIALRRLPLVSLFAVIGLTCFLASGVTVLHTFLLVQTISTAILVIMRPSYVRLIVSGAPLFTAYYFMLLGLWRLLMPGFMDMWNGTELTGRQLLGVPVEEYLWVLSFCTGFPITMAFALDARVIGRSSALMREASDTL